MSHSPIHVHPDDVTSTSPSPPSLPFVHNYGAELSLASLASLPNDKKNIETLMHITHFIPRILSFFTIVELMILQSVSRNYYNHASLSRAHLITRLHFGQFWSRIGKLDNAHFNKIIRSYGALQEITLAYCNFLKDETLIELLSNLAPTTRITKLNLFYCYLLTDKSLSHVCSLFPHLKELNVGRCHLLTDDTMRNLSNLQQLTHVNIIYNHMISEDTIMLFDDPSKFHKLIYLNVLHCSKYLSNPSLIDELKAQRHNMRIIGPQELFHTDKNGKKMKREVDADT